MNAKQNKRNGLFIKACADGFSDIVNFMLDAGGIDLNYLDCDDHSALWHAIHGQHIELAKQLLRIRGMHLATINMAIEEALKQELNDIALKLVEYPYEANYSSNS